jgi:glycosyltransferase involved in cell wall biosynthesis
MRIGIDGNEANVRERVGIGQFAFRVLQEFYQGGSGHSFDVYLKQKPLHLQTMVERKGSWRYRLARPRPFWTQFALPLKLYRDRRRLEVFFSPTHYAPRFCPAPAVISVMDLSFLFFARQFRKRDLYQLKLWTAASVRRAAKIVAISESTRADLLREYRLPGEKVVVAHPGYDRERYHEKIKKQRSKIEKVKAKYGVKGDYLISVGTLQPRKNHVRLVEAFQRLVSRPESGRSGGLSLVVVGKRGWLEGPIFQKVGELGLKGRVILPGFVPDEDLPYLLAGAEVFCLVSLYEGFGIPVLEAMAVGVPAVISGVSSLPEVGGEAAVYVDPRDADQISRVLADLLAQPRKRRQLSRAGLENVKRFSWSKCAAAILDVLESALPVSKVSESSILYKDV